MSTKHQLKSEVRLKEPRLYKVILHNDDQTPMNFVVDVLVSVFGKNIIEASEIMMKIHEGDYFAVGVYDKNIAYTKKMQVDHLANINSFPLKTTVEVV